jgi:S1-C subfamily serine protease
MVLAAGLLLSDGPPSAGAAPEAAPAGDGSELPALEKRVQDAARKALPSVVSFGSASGVIVSADGLVLSQYHVTHGQGAKPGSKVQVALADGTKAEAELLGADPLYDLSALKLTGTGRTRTARSPTPPHAWGTACSSSVTRAAGPQRAGRRWSASAGCWSGPTTSSLPTAG